MSLVDLIMPKLGESIMEATILRWHKQPGDRVAMDETILDIATDKVDSEVPSTAEGIIEAILYNENDVVPIGTVIAKIKVASGTNASASSTIPTAPIIAKQDMEDASVIEEIPYQPSQSTNLSSTGSSIRFYSPLVLNIAQREGINMTELESISGTGQDGRVSKKDILAYVAHKKNNISHATPMVKQEVTVLNSNHEAEPINQTPAIYQGNVEIIEMDRMRKIIAKHMVDSKRTSPHVTSFCECDVTNLVLWRERIKKEFEKREGEKITFTPLFIEAIVKNLRKYPLLSSSLDGDKIIVKKDLNIGGDT